MGPGKPFERLTMVDAVKKYANVDWNEVDSEQARAITLHMKRDIRKGYPESVL